MNQKSLFGILLLYTVIVLTEVHSLSIKRNGLAVVIECKSNDLHILPNPKNCHSFILCKQGVPTIAPCGYGENFNEIKLDCDTPENAPCNQEEEEEEEEEEIPDEEEEEEEEEEDNEFDCPTAGIQMIPHPDTCAKFVLCAFGSTKVFNCAPGLHFDVQNQWCDLIDVVNCYDEEYVLPDCPSNDGEYNLPHPIDCTLFVRCINGARNIMSCPNGFYFEESFGLCVLSENSTCESKV